jgi:putative transcriptional regulator
MPKSQKYLGYALVANANNPRDDLHRSVILLVNHQGQHYKQNNVAVGIQINKPLANMTLKEVAVNIGIDYPTKAKDYLYYGGSGNSGRIHIIHTPDWTGANTIQLNKDVSVTSDISVLNAIANGTGPSQYRACAGHWLWDQKDLDRQLDASDDCVHKWEIAPADHELVFGYDGVDQWRQGLYEAATYSASLWF